MCPGTGNGVSDWVMGFLPYNRFQPSDRLPGAQLPNRSKSATARNGGIVRFDGRRTRSTLEKIGSHTMPGSMFSGCAVLRLWLSKVPLTGRLSRSRGVPVLNGGLQIGFLGLSRAVQKSANHIECGLISLPPVRPSVY